jgi:hypothetical protein
MPKTRDDLVKRALKDLGALPVGQPPADEEYSSVDDLVDPVLENLAARDIFHVPDVAAIDDAAFMPLGICLAWKCAPEFGTAPLTPLENAEAELKVIQSTRPTYKVLEFKAW